MAIKRYLEKSDGREYYKVRVVRRSRAKDGVRIDKAIDKIATLVEAEKIERQLVKEADRDFLTKTVDGVKWGRLIREWALAVESKNIFAREITPAVLVEYSGVLRIYTSEWDHVPIEKIDKAMAWTVMERVEREVSVVRRKRLRSAIDSVYAWAILAGRARGVSSPCAGYKSNRKVEEKIPEILTLEEIRTLLRVAKEQNNPWYPVWALALFTGLRSGELYALEWDVVDFENRMIYVHRNWTNKNGSGPTKGRCWRAVPIGGELEGFLKELKLKSGGNKHVLPRFRSWADGRQAELLRDFCFGNGLPSIRFHTLRACFATQLIKDSVAPAIVMKICGWKDLKTMQRYIRLAGIEVKGATNGLKLLPETEVMGRVLELFAEQ